MRAALVFIPLLTLPLSAQETPAPNPHLEFAKGLLDQSRGKREEAVQRFETARLADPLAMPLVQRAANRRLAEGDLAKAVTLYRDLATGSPDRLDAQFLYVDFLRAQGKGDGMAEKMAGTALEGALQRFPGNPGVLERLFRSSEAKADHERSLKLFNELIAHRPLKPAEMKLAADWSRVLFSTPDKKDPKPAANPADLLDDLFAESVTAYPHDSNLAWNAANRFREAGKLDLAITTLKKHTDAEPSNLDMRIRLGVLYLAAEQNEAGETVLKDVLAIDAHKAIAHESLAKLYRKQNKPDLARPHADSVLKIRGGDPAEFLTLAEEWLAADQPKPARILMEKAAYDHPEDAAIAAKLAIATHRDPETRTKASLLFREAEALAKAETPPEPAFLVESASALIDEKRLPAAEERLRKAIKAYAPEEKAPTAAALRQLADLWTSQNKNADAAKALRQRADSLDPPK